MMKYNNEMPFQMLKYKLTLECDWISHLIIKAGTLQSVIIQKHTKRIHVTIITQQYNNYMKTTLQHEDNKKTTRRQQEDNKETTRKQQDEPPLRTTSEEQ